MPLSAWQVLPGSKGIVLLQEYFTASSYHVRTSDGQTLWAEYLESEEIIRRAQLSECPIDPGSSADNLASYLRELRAGLLSQRSVTCTQSATGMQIESSHSLGNDVMLTWTFQLANMGNLILPSLIQPLMAQTVYYNNAMTKLLDLCGEKDKFLQEMLEAQEKASQQTASNDDPHYLPRRKRALLEKFDADAWRDELRSRINTSLLLSSMAEYSELACEDRDFESDWLALTKDVDMVCKRLKL